MIKDFLLRKMLAAKLKGVPQEEQDKMIAIIQKNPQLFQQIAVEVQQKMKEGKDQMSAAKEVMQKYESTIKDIMK
jgi:hypothetical protein